MASGRPVIAYADGGALETVIEGKTGEFFTEQTSSALNMAIENFEKDPKKYHSDVMREHAANFSIEKFREKLASHIDSVRPVGFS